jgi:hypothetical protein
MSTFEKQFHDRFAAAVTARLPRHRVKTIDEPGMDAVRFQLGITFGAAGTVSHEEFATRPDVVEHAAARVVRMVERDALVAFGPMIADRERELQAKADAAAAHSAEVDRVLADIVVAYALAADNPKLFGQRVEAILFGSRTQ